MNDKLNPDTEPLSVDNLDPTTDKIQPSTPKSPGKIKHGPVSITLHSTHAFYLFNGRRGNPNQHAVIGLKAFSRALERISDRVHLDRIEDALLDAQERIEQLKLQIDKTFSRNHLQPAEKGVSRNPSVIEVKLHTRLAHRGAQLLSEYDQAITRCINLYKLGVHDRHQHATMVRSLSQIVRKAYTSPVFTQSAVIAAQASASEETDDSQPSSPIEAASPAQD